MPTESRDSEPDGNVEVNEAVRSALFEAFDSPRVTFGVVSGACFVAVGLQWILEYCSQVHWGLGASLSLAVASAFVWLTVLAKRHHLAHTRSACAASLLLGLMLAVVVAAWASYTLHTLHIGSYSFTSTSSMDAFMRFYFFTLADLVPLLDITGTLRLQSPVESRDFFAGLPVLGFRIIVLWFLFAEFRAWRKDRKSAGKEKPSDFALFALFFLVFVAIVLPNLR